ncbi:MAG: anti-sigma factor family protein [Thermoguttaceae bacterium]
MNCPNAQNLLQPYADGELDLLRHVEMETHLKQCPACAKQEQNLRSLRAAIRSASLSFRAPAALAARPQLANPTLAPPVVDRRRRTLNLIAVAAAVLILAAASATIGIYVQRSGTSSEERLAESVVAGHIRSLQAGHLMDVASSDRHTVKPWFQGKLDFSPQVLDFSSQGYPLIGGRLDYLADRAVAALVYQHGKHTINVFTWPVVNGADQGVGAITRQGFHIRVWQHAGMIHWAISDINDQDFDEFVRLFQEPSTEVLR